MSQTNYIKRTELEELKKTLQDEITEIDEMLSYDDLTNEIAILEKEIETMEYEIKQKKIRLEEFRNSTIMKKKRVYKKPCDFDCGKCESCLDDQLGCKTRIKKSKLQHYLDNK